MFSPFTSPRLQPFRVLSSLCVGCLMAAMTVIFVIAK